MATNILRLSTDLQSELIRKLIIDSDLYNLLDSIIAKAGEVLQADASSIYVLDPQVGPEGNKVATMRVARGYPSYIDAIGKAQCTVIPSQDVPNQPGDDEKLGLTGWVISTGRSFLAKSPDDVFLHPHWSGKYDDLQMPQKKLRLAAFLAVPLRDPRGRVIGALKAERVEGKDTFSVEDQIILETMARVAGRCITYVKDAQQGFANAAITSWTLDVIAEAVATEGELDAFLDIVVQATAAATQADSCAVFLIDESRQTLTQRAGCGSQVLRTVIRSYKLPDPAQVCNCATIEICDPLNCRNKVDLPAGQRVGLTAWVAATGKSYHASNMTGLKKHCHHLGRFDDPNFEDTEECGAWLGVPLLVGGTIIGVLKIENISQKGIPDERDFDQESQRRLDVLAQDIALAIRRLQIQRPGRYQVIVNAMPTILETLRGGLTVRALVNKVVKETARLFDARACALFLKEGEQLIQPRWAAVGWAQEPTKEGTRVRKYNLVQPDQIENTPKLEQKVGLTVWIAVKKEKFVAKSNLELVSHPHHKGTFDRFNFKDDERCESFMGVPMLLGEEEELVGVLKVETKMREVVAGREVAYFNEQDELVFELIAKSAAIAIQNARLLEARLLADSLVNQPHDRVMHGLHTFIQGRVEVVSTLESTAEEMRRDQVMARIIQNFASVLSPGFYIGVLEQLADEQVADLQTLLYCFAAAIQIKTFDELCGFQAKHVRGLPVAAVLSSDFLLHECANIFVDASRTVNAELESYERDRTKRAALRQSIEILKDKASRVEEMDLFEKSVLGRILARWRELIEDELERFRDIPNFYVAGLPLGPDSPVFVGREEVFRWIQDNLYNQAQKNVLVLHGGWHTGKTSILYQLQGGPLGQRLRERRQRPVFPVFIDLQGMPDPGIDLFLLGVAESVGYALWERDVACPSPVEADFRKAPYRAFDTFLKDVDQLLMQRAQGLLAIMLDEFELLDDRVKTGKIDAEIFSYLRSKMQHQPSVTFILAGRHRLDEMTLEYRTLLFNVALHKEVGFLNLQEAERLVRDPVKPSAVTYDDRVVERIWNLTGGHPFFIQQLCYTCIDLLNKQRRGYQVAEEHLDSALEKTLTYNVILEDLWETEVNEDDREVLKTLAQLSGDEQALVAMSELCEQLELGEDSVSKSLERLETQQLIVRDRLPDRERDGYRYGIDLLRLWVMRRST
jgi:GAF domain-containing protein